MRRSFVSVLALIVLVAESVVAQSTAPPRKLESIPHQLEAHPESLDPLWTIELDSIVQSATIAEIRQVLPFRLLLQSNVALYVDTPMILQN
jgi:hypothetical protein